MEKIRFGVLGAGRGASLAKAMRYTPSAELVAICDVNEERLAAAKHIIDETLGVSSRPPTRIYTAYEAMLEAEDIRAVIVASPMPAHVPHAVQALRAGKDVLSEVTAATTLEQCWELLEAVRASGRQYMLAENYCWYRPWTLVLGLVRAGMFGELYYGEAEQIQEFKGGFAPLEAGGTWRTAELALRLGHQYITHDWGPLYMAFGERAKRVVCLGSGQRHLAWAKADSTCTVLIETESGALVRIRLDFFSDRPNNFTYYGLQGTGAAYEGPRAPGEEHRIYIHGQTPPGQWESLWNYTEYLPEAWRQLPPEAVNDSWDGGSALMIEEFARALLENRRPPIDVVDALNMTAPGLVSEISRARGGCPVDVPEFRL